MTETLYVIFFTVLAVACELILGSLGLFLPMTAVFLFYAAIVFGWRTGIWIAVIASCGLDLASGALLPRHLPGFIIVIALAWFWLNKVESESISLHLIPGALIAPAVWLSILPFFPGSLFTNVFSQLPGVVTAAFCCAILLPLEIFIFDTMNEKLGIDLYTNVKMRLKNQK